MTGGGTGIGLATALELGFLGARVAIGSRKTENVEAGLSQLRARGVDALGAVLDVREPESCDAFVAVVLRKFGKIDVLINNAGGQFPTVAERDHVPLQEPGDHLELDVDHVVTEPAPVREPGVVAADDAEPVLGLRGRHAEVQLQRVDREIARAGSGRAGP